MVEVSRRGSRAVTPCKFGKRTCKPNSVVCGHSSRRRVAADTHQRPTRRFRQLLEPPQRIGPIRSAAWLLAAASLPIWSCSVWGLPCLRLHSRSGALLPHLFTLTPARTGSPGEPFESFRESLRRGVAEAVSFLWHWPYASLDAHIPDVIRHTALRSSDFPPPASAVNESRQRPPGPPASVQCIANPQQAPPPPQILPHRRLHVRNSEIGASQAASTKRSYLSLLPVV